MIDHALAAQEAAEEHITLLWDAEHDGGPGPVDQAAPFCGCLTCEVREILFAAAPHLQKMFEEEDQ